MQSPCNYAFLRNERYRRLTPVSQCDRKTQDNTNCVTQWQRNAVKCLLGIIMIHNKSHFTAFPVYGVVKSETH